MELAMILIDIQRGVNSGWLFGKCADTFIRINQGIIAGGFNVL